MIEPLRVFIGYDPRQPVAYQVLAHSVWSRASRPVSITRLQLSQLAPFTRRGLTEFTFSRFLVPYLCGYRGFGMFLDSDMLCLGDVYDLVALALAQFLAHEKAQTKDLSPRDEAAWDSAKGAQVAVVDHPKRLFERPSMMVFQNVACRMLTPEWVQNEANNPYALESWAPMICHLPPEWNHLVGYDAPNPDAKLVHYTMGIPCWPETQNCEFAKEWHKEAAKSFSTVSFAELMGRSVHVPHVRAGALEQAGAAA